MIRRPPRSTLSSSSAASDVYKRQDRYDDQQIAQVIFRSAARLLKPQGLMLIITLAQDHILELVLESVRTTGNLWRRLDVHELAPKDMSSPLQPFAVVLERGSIQGKRDAMATAFHRASGGIRAVDSLEMSAWLGVIHDSRQRFVERQASLAAMTAGQKRRGMRVVIDVKPWDGEVDLNALAETLKTKVLDTDSVQWEGCNVVPIGFGISKIAIQCVSESSDQIDMIRDLIEQEDEWVQSVDINWDS
eukprot:TRINITY_DN63024_c0_g1_i1.p1 TRINITY_DN63024_c0_g1~~TRINITY_DN63024_c0_g1_i1.p1  ORF type:complete len:247 (+),score=48.82 TRINITY_DN63024_c0_g1_i1:120-860(+)